MREYASKQALAAEIEKTAQLFISEFDDIAEADKTIRFDGVDRTPQEMLAYQLGWMGLIRGWDDDEQSGKEVTTPAAGYKWNQMGQLYQDFYNTYRDYSLAELRATFTTTVNDLVQWLLAFTEAEVFQPGGRKWAASTTANWPIWKWVHINTVAPFKTFRTKIRKWKKLRAAQLADG
ncbi:MAG: ClbS/DfsB family four-helix bundle protein [Propionibacteriaceae bacterium]|jgi:hypothetical protein|nr:ClbS/DfsB family four-helix bundle protein [Propionibacteriaceae bacterium]